MTGAEDLPDGQRHSHPRLTDPLVTLAVVAGATRHLTLGTSVLLAAQHEPIVTAKAIASLDDFSGGRVVIGVGAGENVDFGPLYSWPKPPSGPQVLIGGGRKPAARKIAEYADGWLPIYPGDPAALIGEVTAIREQLGRDVPVTVMNAPADKDVLARLADAGIERALLELPRADRDATLRTLDGHAGLLT